MGTGLNKLDEFERNMREMRRDLQEYRTGSRRLKDEQRNRT